MRNEKRRDMSGDFSSPSLKNGANTIDRDRTCERIADSGSDLYLDPACARVPFE